MINEHKRRTDILVLGLEGVGKSLLIKKLKGLNLNSKDHIGFETNPTVIINN
jgi:GTPase SAR1 family protein